MWALYYFLLLDLYGNVPLVTDYPTAPLPTTQPCLANKIRTQAGAQPATSIALSSILDERARELIWEAWRRNDLIRFS